MNAPLRILALISGVLVPAQVAISGPLLDYIRNYDLNDYALGVAVSAGQNPFAGSDNESFAYPYLTSFRDSSMTNDWLLVRSGDLGLRWISDSGLV